MVSTLRLRLWSPAIAVAVALLMAAVAVPVAAAAGRWIVPAGTPLPAGSLVVGSFPVADALVITGPTAPAGAVDYDAPVTMQSLPGIELPFNGSTVEIDTAVAATDAPDAWAMGEFGEQAVVALVDTGVADVPALQGAVAGEIDFTGTGGGDGYGHGTFLASLIAGRGVVAPGVAPEAGILSLKVGASDGTATLGAVVSALQWLHGPGASAGLRVATLAFGVDATSDAAKILDHAADAVARKGILVITATGNEGGHLSSPATARHTLSVGASDDDGVVSDFSGSGVDSAGVAQPDMTAPGEAVAGSMPADSVIGRQNNAWVAGYDGLFRGSGTSMATALTAGVAALASSARPDLDGDALAGTLGAGNGAFADADAAVAAALAAPEGKPVNSPPWAQEPAEHPSTNAAHHGNGGNGNGKSGGDSNAEPKGLRWTGLRWTGLRWTGLRWTGLRWTGDGWGDADWAFGRWAGLRWTGLRWTGAGDVDATPAGLRWTGLRWTGLRWTGLRWTGLRWTGLRWTMLEAETT